MISGPFTKWVHRFNFYDASSGFQLNYEPMVYGTEQAGQRS